jgi:mannose-6-phosphate isomerase-like protein (cupin superfamily)
VSYKVARIEEIDDIDYREDTHMHPVRHHLGITAFGANAWTVENVGDRLMPEHEEDEGNEELYVVLRGRARFEIAGESVDAPEGTLVFVQPLTNRTAFAEEAGTTVLAIGSRVGKPYEVGGWEVWAPVHTLYEAGEYEAAIEKARPIAEANPHYGAVLYNLACCEALAGHNEDAIGHLGTALERRPGLRELAREDSDFDSIREEPAFKELVA